ncbi:MAG: hypothetical protein K6U75_12360 [Firmicutes bacterium]|nr:hypothetical protein [Bacillota bacterium]
MANRKSQTVSPPSESTVSLLEPARGVSEASAPQLAQVAGQLLNLPMEEQLAAVRWMGTQPEYATLLAYLVEGVGVSGALRRAVKQAMFELRRRGVSVQTLAAGTTLQRESTDTSAQWVLQEAFASSPYEGEDWYALHLRFFMQHASGQKAVFNLFIDEHGYLVDASMVDEGVRDLYQECLDNPLRYPWIQQAQQETPNRFVRLPLGWAITVAHECRRRTLRDLKPMPPHAAYYWGRLPESPEETVSPPWDSISDAETSWAVSSLVTPDTRPEPTVEALNALMPYLPPPDRLLDVMERAAKEMQSPILLPTQTEEQRNRQIAEKLQQWLFPDESLRGLLLFMLPVLGGIHLLGGDHNGAAWLKALWRELKERTDRPFWRTEAVRALTAMAVQMMTFAAEAVEEGEDEDHVSH